MAEFRVIRRLKSRLTLKKELIMLEHTSVYLLMAKDILEISFLSIICYQFLYWVKHDNKRPLLNFCYLYILIFILSFLLQLTTLLTLLGIGLPFFLTTISLMRAQMTEKQLVSSDQEQIDSNLIEILVRFCLTAECNLQFIIEQHVDVQEMLAISLPLQTTCTKTILSYLIDCNKFNAEQYIILASNGKLLGINAIWQESTRQATPEQRLKETCHYLQGTDAIAFYFNHEQRTFTLILNQKIYRSLTSTQLLQSIQWYRKTDHQTEGFGHEQNIKKDHQEQSLS